MPPRVIRPKDESGSNSNNDQSDRSSVKQSGSKRRAVPSACIPCRRRKSKCDGGTPSCSTCIAVYRTECSYDADNETRPRGTTQRLDVHSLQQRTDALEVVVASLRGLPETEAISLLYSLRTSTNTDLLAVTARSKTLSPGSQSGSISDSTTAQNTPADHQTPFKVPSESPPTLDPSSSSQAVAGHPIQSNHAATQILQHTTAVRRLLDVYFAWVHPFNQLFSRNHFMNDMHDNNNLYHDSLLLHAVLAFACHYVDFVEIQGEHISAASVSEYCFDQAEALLASVEKPHITTVHSLGVMAIRTASMGFDSKAYHYVGRCLRTILELNLHSSKPSSSFSTVDPQVRRITLWGAYNLETLCAMHAGRPPQLPRYMIEVEKPMSSEKDGTEEWHACGHEHQSFLDQQAAGHPVQLTSFHACLSSLSEIASSVATMLYSPAQSFTSRTLMSTYERYMHWFHALPEQFRISYFSLPHVIVLHIFFRHCLINLFRPYIKLDLRAAHLYPQFACTESADEIFRLIALLRNSYGLRRVPMIIVHSLIAASAIHVSNLPSEAASTKLRAALEDLSILTANHPCASNGISVIRSLASQWSIRLPEDVLPQTSPSVRSPQLTSQSFASGMDSEPYSVLFDHIGSQEDVYPQVSPWPFNPIISPIHGFPGEIMSVSEQAGQTGDWARSSQQTESQHGDQHDMSAMSWQWHT